MGKFLNNQATVSGGCLDNALDATATIKDTDLTASRAAAG